MNTSSGGQVLATIIQRPHHAQWGTGQYPDLSIVALWDKLASTALMSSKFKVCLGYIVSLKPHSQKIKIAERNVLVPGKPRPLVWWL